MNNISSLSSLLTSLLNERIEASNDERKVMADSLKAIEALKAKIRTQAEKEIEDLDRLAEIAEKYSFRLVSGEDQQGNNDSTPDKTASAAPAPPQRGGAKVYASGYMRHKKPWTDTIVDILKRENRGLSKAELKTEVEKTHLASRLQETETGFYGAISKLKTRKKILEHNGRLYTPKTFAQFQQDVEAGLIKDTPLVNRGVQSSEMKNAILRYLSAARYARSSQIIKMLLTNNKMGSSKGSVYNLLSNLVDNGELKKSPEGHYSLNKKNEASTGEPGDASVNGRGATLPIGSYESGVRRTLDS